MVFVCLLMVPPPFPEVFKQEPHSGAGLVYPRKSQSPVASLCYESLLISALISPALPCFSVEVAK